MSSAHRLVVLFSVVALSLAAGTARAADLVLDGAVAGPAFCPDGGTPVTPGCQQSATPAANTGCRYGGELEQACRGGADTTYPYGQTYLPDACNGVDNPIAPQGAAPTGSLASCAVGTPALYDLSGNVAEWTGTQTNASPAPGRIFQLHGGSYLSPVLGLACTVELAPRANEGTLLPNIGFRCCWANP